MNYKGGDCTQLGGLNDSRTAAMNVDLALKSNSHVVAFLREV